MGLVFMTPQSIRYLATCSADTTVKIWLVGSNYEFKLDKTLHGHQRWVWDAAFSADSAYLVTGVSLSPLARRDFLTHYKHLQIMLRDCGNCRLERLCDSTMAIIRQLCA